jgi:hypothetical protein
MYLVHTKSVCECDDGWAESFQAGSECPGCGALAAERQAGPIDVRVKRKPDISALNFASPVLVHIARTDFLKLFQEEVDRHLLVGRVCNTSGRQIRGFATYFGRRPLMIRGGPKSTRRYCGECGQFVYYPLGKWYVMRESLTGQGLYEGCGPGGGLVITAELRERIERGKWKGIWITKLPIRDEPLDGIEKFPENYY